MGLERLSVRVKTIESNNDIFRSVDLFVKHNEIKNERLNEMYLVYSKAFATALAFMLRSFYETKLDNRFGTIKSMAIKEDLELIFKDYVNIASKRLLTLIYGQAYGVFKSHVKLVKYYIVDFTKKAKSLKGNKSLYYDYKEEIKNYRFNTDSLLRSIFRHTVKRLAIKPSLKLRVMNLDSHVVTVEDAKNSTLFDKWLRVAPLKGREPIYIPYKNSEYKENNALKAYQFIRIENRFSVRVSQVVDKQKYNPSDKVTGIDLGLSEFFSTSSNKVLGGAFIAWLKKHDKALISLQAELQRRGIKPRSSKRYKKLVQKIRDYAKNEINRLFNQVMKYDQPKLIRVEFLDFRNQNLGKTTNRLLTRIGNKYVEEKLQRLANIYGIEVEYVNPAYTSQTCSNCDYVDENNRKGNIFHCLCCGYKTNANTNASNNISRRSRDSLKLAKKQALIEGLTLFERNHLIKRLGTNIFSIRARSCARTAIVVNPYLEDYFVSSNRSEVI